MGRKPLIPYGLYRANVYVSPLFARQTGFSSDDLDLLWQALTIMWDLDRSAARGTMACRGLHVFSHTSPWGNAPAQALFDRVRVERRDTSVPPRAFSDYAVTINTTALPPSVTYADLSAAVAAV
jgi:CRISPR-associated protein Csd2